MKGKKTDPNLIQQIDALRKEIRTSEIVKKVEGRLSARSVYRIVDRLKKEDARREKEKAERLRQIEERKLIRELERMEALKKRKFKSVSQIPPNVRRFRSF